MLGSGHLIGRHLHADAFIFTSVCSVHTHILPGPLSCLILSSLLYHPELPLRPSSTHSLLEDNGTPHRESELHSATFRFFHHYAIQPFISFTFTFTYFPRSKGDTRQTSEFSYLVEASSTSASEVLLCREKPYRVRVMKSCADFS